MSNIKLYNRAYVNSWIKLREGEIKFGERVHVLENISQLKKNPAKYVLLGIPEDIGVYANYGVRGSANSWKHCLKSLLNMQANTYTNAEDLLILGEIDCDDQMEAASHIFQDSDAFKNEIGKLVEAVDAKVADIVKTIISAGKIPVIIGGGHNNAYGNLKGATEALSKPVNVINFDAHTDFRPLEHRHSGNGFSYAMENGYLNKYALFGIQKSYTSQEIYKRIESLGQQLALYFYEDIQLKENPTFENAMLMASKFLGIDNYGVELDVDAIENFPSSAASPNGFSLIQARQFLRYFSKKPQTTYVHICEAKPYNDNDGTYNVGKALSACVLDVISD